MHQGNIPIDEDEIDIKELFRVLYRYKYMIITFVILFGIASGYIAYFKPNIYRASSIVEVGMQKNSGDDILSMAMEPGTMNADTEIGIIQSRFLAKKALEHVDFSHRYFTVRDFREIELYKDSPFKVGMLKGFDTTFKLYGIDKEHYRLVVDEATDKNGKEWSYDKKHTYGQEVVTTHFHLNVAKMDTFSDAFYTFIVTQKNEPLEDVKVSQTTKRSNLLKISYEDNVPLRAQEYANALANAYIEQNIEKKAKEATLKLDFIDAQLKKINENLKNSAVKIEEFKKGANTVNLSSKAESIIKQMSETEAKLEEITMQSETLNTFYKQIEKGKNLEAVSVIGIGSGNEALAKQIGLLQDAILKKKVLREDYTEMYPAVVKLRKQISYLKKNIIETIKNLKDRIGEQKQLLEASLEKHQKNLNTLPANERMYGQLQRKFAVNEKIYSYLLEKRSETAIVKAATVSKNRIIDLAEYPQTPIKPKRKLIVLVGLILGLIVGIALAFLRNYLDDTIQGEEDVTHAIDLPLLGSIPHIKDVGETLKVFSSPKSVVTEAFRSVRTNLEFMKRRGRAHVIAVTSTIGSEGKTTISTNLAAIMSIANKKTIVLNLDMRKPTLHERFNLPNQQGMSTLLAESTPLGNVIQTTAYENLDVITSGPVPPNPSELIQNDLMEKILDKLGEVYEIIILDTPPLGLVTDARTLMNLADTSIYVLRAGYSKKAFINHIKSVLKLQEIHGLSILLNDVNIDKSGYGYGYGYGYYEEDRK